MSVTLNLLSGRLLISVSLSVFPPWGLVLFFHLEYIFLSPHFAWFCFHMLGKLTTSPSLEGVGICRRYTMGPRSTIPPHHQSQGLKNAPMWAVCAHLFWQESGCGTLVGRTLCLHRWLGLQWLVVPWLQRWTGLSPWPDWLGHCGCWYGCGHGQGFPTGPVGWGAEVAFVATALAAVVSRILKQCMCTSISRLKWKFQDGTCQYWHYQSRIWQQKWRPTVSPSLGLILADFCLCSRCFRTSKWVSFTCVLGTFPTGVLLQGPSISSHEPFKRMGSPFSIALWFSSNLLVFKVQLSGGSFFLWRI